MPYGNCGDYYGRGDYYRGDYYRGDLFKTLGSIGGALLKTVGTVLPGPFGAVAKAASAIISPSKKSSMALLPAPGLAMQDGGGRPIIGFGSGPQQPYFGAGQFGPDQVAPGVSLTPSGQLVPCQLKGYHPNKSSYYRRVGGPGSLSGILVPKNSVCVRRRSMNPTNGRALKRALRRAYAFKKIAMRTVRLLNPTKPKRFGGFKKRGK